MPPEEVDRQVQIAQQQQARRQQLPTVEIDPETNYPAKTPHELNPNVAEDLVWTKFPWDSLFTVDPLWYDTFGRSKLEQKNVWKLPTAEEQISVVSELLEEFPNRGLYIMFQSAVKGNSRIIEFLLERGVNPQARPGPDGDDETLVPLHAAAFNDHLDCVKILVEKGNMPVDTKDDIGGTPLIRACWGGNVEVVEWLLENGADPTVRQANDPFTGVLEFAAGKGNVEVVRLLLDHPVYGSKEGRKYQEGAKGVFVTPLAIEAAASSGYPETLKLLLQRGGYPLEDKDGVWKGSMLSEEEKGALDSAVLKAADKAYIDILDILFTYFVPPSRPGELESILELNTDSLRDSFIQGLFYEAQKNQNPENFDKLWSIIFPATNLTQVAEIRALVPDLEHRLLVVAVDADAGGMVYHLMEKYGADPGRFVAWSATTALYTAARKVWTDSLIQIFEKSSPNLHTGNGKYANGPTALCLAVMSDRTDCSMILLEHGGPVEKIEGLELLDLLADDYLQDDDQLDIRVVLEVSTPPGYRAPVRFMLKKVESKEDLEEIKPGFKSVNFGINGGAKRWIKNLQLRASDEELAKDGTGRELMSKPKEVVQAEL